MNPRHGILFVISAPSGGGKSTLLRNLAQQTDFVYSVSCTTRPPRTGEVEGRDYHFLSPAEFARRIAAGDFLEYASVHRNLYGTLKSTVLQSLTAGQDILLDLDIQGAAQIRSCADPAIRRAMVDVFLMPPTFAELERRLHRRGTETAEQLAIRLRNADREMAAWTDYQYRVVSGTPAEDLRQFRIIMEAERLRTRHWLAEQVVIPSASP